MNDLIVAHGHVVTMDAARTVIPDGAVAIRGRDIIAVGPSRKILAAHRGELIDAGGHLVLPGLIDCHLHAGLYLTPGLRTAGMGDFARWPVPAPNAPWGNGADLAAILGGGIDRLGFTEDEVYAAGRAACVAAIKAGTTCFNDGAADHGDALARAVADTGLRAVVTVPALDLKAENGGLVRHRETEIVLEEAEAFFRRWHGGADGRITAWFNLYILAGCSAELCRGVKELADRHATGFSAHAEIGRNEAEASRSWHGARSLERAETLGILGPNFLGVHLGWAAQADIARLAASDTKVAHCPSTSTAFGSGFIANGMIPRMREAGVTVGLGSDSFSSGDMIRQLHDTSFHRDLALDVNVMDAPDALEMATIGSARACLLEHVTGSLEPGKRADLIMVDMSGLHWRPRRHPVRAFVELAHPEDVRTVIVDGRVLMRDRRLAGIDEDQVAHDLERALESVLARRAAA